jgi:hypothetical protein
MYLPLELVLTNTYNITSCETCFTIYSMDSHKYASIHVLFLNTSTIRVVLTSQCQQHMYGKWITKAHSKH